MLGPGSTSRRVVIHSAYIKRTFPCLLVQTVFVSIVMGHNLTLQRDSRRNWTYQITLLNMYMRPGRLLETFAWNATMKAFNKAETCSELTNLVSTQILLPWW
ncbi:hypothetical protein MANI_030348 [Metarhizium anisopliae]|nr:hypothetical protein MANI_030348 [Metarhizium anisopliae]